jgi:hypothetical protein
MKRCRKYNGGEVGGLLTASLGVKPSVEGRRLLHCVRNDGGSRRNLLGFGRNLLGLIAALLISGCSNEGGATDNGETAAKGREITFRVQGSMPSTYTLPSTLADIDAFTVNGWVDAAATNKEVLFERKSVVKDATSGAFTYSPTVYFPVGATSATFVAYSPVNINVGVGSGGFELSNSIVTNDNKITYTVPNPAEGGGTLQKDLLVACTAVPNINAAGASAVALRFKHALARLVVSITNNTQDPLVVKGLTLNHIFTTGDLDIDGDIWTEGATGTPDINDDYVTSSITTSDQYKVLWDNNGTDHTMQWLLPVGGVVIDPDSAAHAVTTNEQAMLVLPQITLLASGNPQQLDTLTDFHLRLDYTLNNLDAVRKIAFGDVKGLDEVGYGLTFEMGKQYNLNLEFNAKGVSFTVDIEDWTVDGNDIQGVIP